MYGSDSPWMNKKCDCCGQPATTTPIGFASKEGGQAQTYYLCKPCEENCTSDDDGRPICQKPKNLN